MSQAVSKRVKITSFDLIRAICTTGIVLFHYSYNYVEYGINGSHLYFKYTNGNWGSMLVAVFFMLSGAVLWYNYRDNFKLFKFYFRRAMSIFPMFYLAWFIVYLQKVKELGSWLWAGPRRVFLYTVFGIDGYFLNPGYRMTYYTLGEWFLGAIVMLYLIFPVLRFLFMKHKVTGYSLRIVFTILITAAYIWNLYSDYFKIADGKNMFTCIMDFWIGMLIMDMYTRIRQEADEAKRAKTERIVWVISLITGLIFMYVPMGINEVMISTIVATFLFMAFIYIGEMAMKFRPVATVCTSISAWSFGIFLVHHVILYAFMKPYAGGSIDYAKSLLLFAIVYVIICAVGALLAQWGSLVNKVVKKIPLLSKL